MSRAATDEVARQVRARTRTFSHGNGPRYAGDPQIQQVVGEVSAAAFAAEAIALRAADDPLDRGRHFGARDFAVLRVGRRTARILRLAHDEP